jgi:predicted enzyme related to lactoylglutathione lyase
MAHPAMWFEVLGSDGGKLRRFYGDLFGWTFDVIQPINYGVAKTGDGRGSIASRRRGCWTHSRTNRGEP